MNYLESLLYSFVRAFCVRVGYVVDSLLLFTPGVVWGALGGRWPLPRVKARYETRALFARAKGRCADSRGFGRAVALPMETLYLLGPIVAYSSPLFKGGWGVYAL